jgi:hypothetical protein
VSLPKVTLRIDTLDEARGGWDQITTRLELGEHIEIRAPDGTAIARLTLERIGERLL